MKVSVLLFASVREAINESKLEIELPSPISNLSQFRSFFIELYPTLAKLEFRLAVNKTYAINEDEACLKDGDEIALIPPISGG